MDNQKGRRTFIILFVIIAIIALALSIIIPVLKRAYPTAKLIVCKSNIRQLDIAFLLYHEDNKMWAVKQDWCDLIKPYIGEENSRVFRCREDKTGPCSYAMNENIPADVNELPADLVVLFEAASGWNQIGGADDVVTDRHGKPGANIAFADGRVEFVAAEEIAGLRWTINDSSGQRQ